MAAKKAVKKAAKKSSVEIPGLEDFMNSHVKISDKKMKDLKERSTNIQTGLMVGVKYTVGALIGAEFGKTAFVRMHVYDENKIQRIASLPNAKYTFEVEDADYSPDGDTPEQQAASLVANETLFTGIRTWSEETTEAYANDGLQGESLETALEEMSFPEEFTIVCRVDVPMQGQDGPYLRTYLGVKRN